MKRSFKQWLCLVSLFLVLALLSACAQKQEARKRYFWPPLDENPKIEYLGVIQSDYDVEKPSYGLFEEVIFGREIPKGLFQQPFSVYADKGMLYVTEAVEGVVHALDLRLGRIDYLSDRKGRVFLAKQPMGVDGDGEGKIYLVDSLKKSVFVFGSGGRQLDEFIVDALVRPVNLSIDSARERLYIADPGQHAVVVLSSKDGRYLETIGKRGDDEGEFNFPLDVDIGPEGNLYVLDSMNARVQVFSSEGKYLRSFGERGTALGSFQMPKGLTVSPGGLVCVTDSLAHRFVIFDSKGRFLLTIGDKAVMHEQVFPGGFNLPQGIDADASGGIWVVDGMNRMLHHFQIVDAAYLESNPILPGQAANPFVNQ